MIQSVKNSRSGSQGPIAGAGPKPKVVDPVPGWRDSVTSGQGSRANPMGTSGTETHNGIDIAKPQGTPIQAAKDGKVVFAGECGGFGNLVVLKHGDGTFSLYAHQSAIEVKAGQDVQAGDVIGKVGSTGRSTGPHLHFEVRAGADEWGAAQPVDPVAFLEGAESLAPTPAAPSPAAVAADNVGVAGNTGSPSTLSLPRGSSGGASGGAGRGSSAPAPAPARSGGGSASSSASVPALPSGFDFSLGLEEIIKALGLEGEAAENFRKMWPHLAKALQEKGITDPRAIIAALATIKTETGSFLPISEYGGGSQYEGREDLGNTQPGDGERFKGRGFIQLTGRANYEAYGRKLGVDLVGNPELANDPEVAARVLAQYFVDRNIPQMAANNDWVGTRKAVNGGTNGLDTYMAAVNGLVDAQRQLA